MKDTVTIKVIGNAELSGFLPQGYENKEVLITSIGDVGELVKKSLENGEFLWTYKYKTRLITDIQVGEQKIEIKPQKGSWAQTNRMEIISFWKNQVRDKSEKTHQDVYNDFIKFVESKKAEFYSNYVI